MKCLSCGAEATGKFCEYCGSEMPQDKPTVNIVNNYYGDATQREVNEDESNIGKCPKCGNSKITFKRERVGTITQAQTRGNNRGTSRQGQSVSQIAYRTVGVCQNCGHTWDPNIAEEPEKSPSKKTWLWVLGWIFIFPLPLTILLLRKKDMKPAVKYGIIAAAWILFLLIALLSNNETETTQPETPPSYTENVQGDRTTDIKVDNGDVDKEQGKNSETSESVRTNTHNKIEMSEKIKSFLFNVKSWDSISKEQSENSGIEYGLEFDLSMGWGGTSWTYYFSDSEKNQSLVLHFVNPEQDNFADHLKSFSYNVGNVDESLEYYSSWNRENDGDGKYGFYVGEKKFEDLSSAYEYFSSLTD